MAVPPFRVLFFGSDRFSMPFLQMLFKQFKGESQLASGGRRPLVSQLAVSYLCAVMDAKEISFDLRTT